MLNAECELLYFTLTYAESAGTAGTCLFTGFTFLQMSHVVYGEPDTPFMVHKFLENSWTPKVTKALGLLTYNNPE